MPRLALLLLLASVGCPSASTTAPSVQPEPEPQPEPAPAQVAGCPAPDPFVTLSWVPPAAEAVTLLDAHDEALPEALEQLAEGVKSPQRGLPIRVAFSLGQWTWQVPLLRTTLSQAGFDPAQLVHLSLPDGASAWAWPQSCDLETITANLERGWGLSLRKTPYGAVATAAIGEDGELAFAYDFLAFGASAYVLVPAGRAPALAQRFGERPRDPAATNLGDSAAALAAAPVRLAVRSGALLTPGAEPGAEGTVAAHRVDGSGWSTTAPES